MRLVVLAVVVASIAWMAACEHGGGGFHSGGGGGGGGGFHSYGGGGGGGGRIASTASYKPSFGGGGGAHDSSGGARPSVSYASYRGGAPSGASSGASGGPAAAPRPWTGHASKPALGENLPSTIRQIFESIGEAALYTLLDPTVIVNDDDVEPAPPSSDETVDPCQQCPLDDPCGTCAGYGGYACQNNPSRMLDRCVSTAPRNVEPIAN